MLRATVRPATAADLPAIAQLLIAADLPTEGVEAALDGFVVAQWEGAVVAAAGIERSGDVGLLRSVVVAEDARGNGFGWTIVNALIADAGELYLLTTTAAAFFARLSFTIVDRASVPAGIKATAEFSTLCPDSATVMRRARQ